MNERGMVSGMGWMVGKTQCTAFMKPEVGWVFPRDFPSENTEVCKNDPAAPRGIR